MTPNELRTFTAAIILSGLFANKDAARIDIEVHEAIIATDALLEGLNDLEPLKKRIIEWSERRRKGCTPPNPEPGWYPKDRYPPAE